MPQIISYNKSDNKVIGQRGWSLWSIATQKSMIFGWISLGIVLGLTFYFWFEVRNSSIQRGRERFEIQTNEIKDAIVQRISAYEQVLKSGRGLFTSSDSVKRDEWKIYIRSLELEKNYPGILGVGYAKVIYPGEIKRFENQVMREGFKNFKVWPEYKRDIYTSILYLEPFEGRNLRAFGYDMLSEPVRRAAMELAMDSSTISVTDKVVLVQETSEDVQSGFLMYIPLYKPGADISTVEKRRAALKGFIYSPFRMNDLMQGILSRTLSSVKMEIFSRSISEASLMYTSVHVQKSESSESPLFQKTSTFPFAHNSWTLRFTSLPDFEKALKDERPILILITGLLTFAFIFVLVISLATNNYLVRELDKLIESTGEGIYGLDLKGKCTFINRAASKMFGRDPEEFYNKQMHSIMHYNHEDGTHYPVSECPISRASLMNETVRVDNEVFWRADGTSFPVEYTASPIRSKGEINGLVVTFNDISQRKETFEKLSYSLQEKVILLKEVHHRVKNNLQIISSLLNLQSQYLKEEGAHEIFKESQNRIRSMALIHEKLYQTSNMSRLNIAGYVHELVMNLMRSYDTSGKINFRMDIEDVLLNIDTAITLGLTINEVVSNSLKHAFPKDMEGEIYISLKEEQKDHFLLLISDNGIGFPGELDFRKTASLGLQLVNTLVEQLDGAVKLDKDKGTKFTIRFTAPSEKDVNPFN